MNKIVSLFFCLCVAACSAPDESDDVDFDLQLSHDAQLDPALISKIKAEARLALQERKSLGFDEGSEGFSEEGSELGQSRQGFTIHHGPLHGQVSGPGAPASTRCNHDFLNYGPTSAFPNTYCTFPPRRNLTFKIPTGGTPEQNGQVRQFMSRLGVYANEHGWSLTVGASGSIPVTLTCSLGGALGVTAQTSPSTGPLKRLWLTTSVFIDPCAIVTEAQARGFTFATVLEHVSQHEMMHAISFGHRGGSSSTPCHDRLMFAAHQNCNGTGPSNYWTHVEEDTGLLLFDVD